MNDLVEVIIKLGAALVAPKAALRYLVISLMLILTWIFLRPLLSAYGLPIQLILTILPLVSVGVGSLVNILIFKILDVSLEIYTKIKNKRVEEEEKLNKLELKLNEDKVFVEDFSKIYEYMNLEMREILWELIDSDKCFSESYSESQYRDNRTLTGLINNKLIRKTNKIDSSSSIYTINPIIKDKVLAERDTWVNNGIDSFMSNLTPIKEAVLDILKLREDSFDGKVRIINKGFYRPNFHVDFHPCFEVTYKSKTAPFYISFNTYFLSGFERRLGIEFVDEMEVVFNETTSL